MNLKIKRKVSSFSSKGKDYGKIIITSEELAQFIGKEVSLDINIEIAAIEWKVQVKEK